MDHHCPWINSCVGHANHTNFLMFLFFVPFGCMHGVVVNSNFLYHLLSYHFTYHRVYFDLNLGWVLFAISGISFGAGTALGVLILFLTQVGWSWHFGRENMAFLHSICNTIIVQFCSLVPFVQTVLL